MACKSCGQSVPIIRKGLPTIYAFGPFPDHEEVDYNSLENGSIQEKTGGSSGPDSDGITNSGRPEFSGS